MWIDDINVVDHWGAAGENQVEVQLWEGLHPLRVEYNERGGVASVSLSWKQGDADREVIPDTAFFHNPELARVRGIKKP